MACAKQFSIESTSTLLSLRCAITESGLPVPLIAHLPNATGILTESTVTTIVSEALL